MLRYLVALFLALFATAAEAQPPAPGTYVVHAIDVGSGLSIFVEGADFTLLYDAGSSDDTPPGSGNRVLAYLRAIRPDLRCIDHIFLSHAHLDHFNLLPDVLSAYEVPNIWASGGPGPSALYRRFLQSVAAEPGATFHRAIGDARPADASVPARTCSDGPRPAATASLAREVAITPGRVRLGEGAFMTVVSDDGMLSDLHAGNLVVRLDLGSRRILLPGDAGGGRRAAPASPPDPGSTEARLIQCCAVEIRADILISPHHGSRSSSRTAFLDTVGASIYVVSAGPREFGNVINPDSDVLREYLLRGSLWRTDVNDYGCRSNPAKIGPDDDGRPGGCDNIRISIDRAGAMTAAYSDRAD
jgi:competence protein ComEC